MPRQARVIWDPSFTKYDFGPTHPMAPIRLDLTARPCDALGVFDNEGVEVVVDKMSSPYLSGAVIDFADTIEKQGFTIDNPNAQSSCACGDSFH